MAEACTPLRREIACTVVPSKPCSASNSLVAALSRQYSTPAARAAVPGLLAAYQGDVVTPPEEWLRISLRPQLYAILDAAPAGEVDPAVDRDDVFDLLLAGVLARVFVPTVAGRHRPLDRTVELVLRLLRAPAG